MVHTHDIFEGVEAKLTISDILEKAKYKILYGMIVLIAMTLLVSYGSVALVIEMIGRNNPSWNTWKRFDDSFQNQQLHQQQYPQQVASRIIPMAQKWFYQFEGNDLLLTTTTAQQPPKDATCSSIDGTLFACNSGLLPSPLNRPLAQTSNDTTTTPSSSCISSFLSNLQQVVPTSNPVDMDLVLHHMGLRNSVHIRQHLAEFLHEPQPLQDVYDSTQACWSSVVGLSEMACFLQDATHNWKDLFQQESAANYVRYIVHVAIVVNTLLSRGLSLDGVALQEVLGILQQDQWPAVLQYRNKGREDAVEAYHRAGMTLQSLVDAAAGSGASTTMATLFTLNGLHSFERDVTHGFLENGRVGLALATATSKQGNSQSWTNAYTTWQLAHLIGSEPLYQLPQVLVPSVTCPSAAAVPSTAVFNYPLWLQNHILATSLNRMLVPEMDASDGSSATSSSSSSVDVNELQDYLAQNDNGPYPLADRFDEAQTLGIINTEVVELSSPSRDYVERRLYDWCGERCHRTAWNLNIDSFPISNLGNQGFRLYYSMFLWVTGVLAGLGSELFVCLLYLRTWSPERELWWRYVQLLFPLVVTTAVGLASQRNFLALTFVVFGLWKFGFPETIMYLYVGLFDVKASRLLRTADILNGLGTIMHHTIVVWYVAMQLGGVFGVDRYILTTATVPLMQHWFPLVGYANTNLYAVIQISLEVYFEWSVFSYMDHFYNYHGLALAIVPGVLVVAHWFYLAAAVIELIAPELVEDEDEDGDDNLSVSTNNTPFRNVHTRGLEVFVRQHNISCHSSNHSLGSEGHVNGGKRFDLKS